MSTSEPSCGGGRTEDVRRGGRRRAPPRASSAACRGPPGPRCAIGGVRSLLVPSVATALLSFAGPSVARDAVDAVRVAEVTRPARDFTRAEVYELNPGGAATSFGSSDRNAFSHPSANMRFERQLDFRVGDGIFRKLWVSSPASTKSSDGLGPLFNARSCQSCHVKDGRGRPPAAGARAVSLLLRLSVPPRRAAARARLARMRAAVVPEATYGTQLQNFSVQGVPAEGRIGITYEERTLSLAGGARVRLLRPHYAVLDPGYGSLDPEAMLSPRVAPPMIGVGLVEAIPETDILALADPHDADGDGISGRARRVWSARQGRITLGRFGWKAGAPSVEEQTAGAFAGDIGLSSYLRPSAWGDCTARETLCRGAPHGSDPAEGVEVPRRMFDLVVFYAKHLAVPARRNVDDARVLAGKRLFYESGCIGCHRPKFVTARDAEQPEHGFQLVWPYSDFLLHDMGEALADHRPEGGASGREWRTPPLWGIGLTEEVSGHSRFLHDGRARNLLEAVLWHGGEAEAAREAVVRMSVEERAALLAFLRSL